ncbi:hypothetical protein ILYODFUR_025434 [Ilyodon furcidens]|uniref:Uncharacterized protein n=1 Tax=Ilyodon furcidens TaxID=33524 RepID=A0ABV0TLH5_9TELE
MSFKPKSHKGLGDEELMARLRAFASDGVWPSNAGNRPAPRQKKWHALYQKIEKCPIQSRGQTTLFGVSATCDCGFHAAEPAFQPPPPVAPQSVASESTSSAPRSFLRAPPSISKVNVFVYFTRLILSCAATCNNIFLPIFCDSTF